MKNVITIAEGYSRFPGGRFPSDGPNNGEKFRNELLAPALKKSDHVEVVLDGVMGLPSSFLEEAFGGLLRHGFDIKEIRQKLTIVASEERLRRYPDQAWSYINSAAEQ